MTKPSEPATPARPVSHEQRQDQPLKKIADTQDEVREEAEEERKSGH